MPPAARNTVGAAILTEYGLNQAGLNPNATAHSLIVAWNVLYVKHSKRSAVVLCERKGSGFCLIAGFASC